jgi:hypothetical protein
VSLSRCGTRSSGFLVASGAVYGPLSAYFMPRMFAGQTAVFPVRIYLNTVTLPLLWGPQYLVCFSSISCLAGQPGDPA